MSALLAFEGTPATTCQGSGYHDPVPLRHVWHHVMPLEAGGQTVASNLVQLDDACHYTIHRLMWYLRLQSEGTITPDQVATLAHPPRRAQLALAQQGYDACVAAGTVAKIPNEGLQAMRTVALGGKVAAGRVALVDDADYDLVSAHRWHVSETPRTTYAQTSLRLPGLPRRYRNVFMHTLLTGWPQVDHADHDGLNNQRFNLRQATFALNGANRRANLAGTSRFKGVCWAKDTRKWQAEIRVDGRRHYLGQFADEMAAARAYDAAALEAWGEYASLNCEG